MPLDNGLKSPWDNTPVVVRDKQVVGDTSGAEAVRYGTQAGAYSAASQPATQTLEAVQQQQSAPAPSVQPNQPVMAPPAQTPQVQPVQPQQTQEVVQTSPPVEADPFEVEFQKRFGMPTSQAASVVQGLQNFQQQQQVDQGKAALTREWGVDATEGARRFALVQRAYQEISATNPQLAQQLDNVEGAKQIWDNYIADEHKVSVLKPPVLDNGTARLNQVAKPYTYTREQVINMSPDDVKANWASIIDAYQSGKVR